MFDMLDALGGIPWTYESPLKQFLALIYFHESCDFYSVEV